MTRLYSWPVKPGNLLKTRGTGTYAKLTVFFNTGSSEEIQRRIKRCEVYEDRNDVKKIENNINNKIKIFYYYI